MRALWAVPALALVLTGCSSDPKAQLRGDVEAITLAANDRDAEAVREEVEDLLSTIRSQIASGDLDRAEGERLRVIALRIAEGAVLLEPEPSPSPVSSPTQEESPPPEPSPTEEPSPSPEPSPTEEPSPETSPEPSPAEESPLIEVSPAASEPSPTEAAGKGPKKGAAAESPEPSPQTTT